MRERAANIGEEELSFGRIVETTCKAYQLALGEAEPNWPPDDDLLSAWRETMEFCLQMVEQAQETLWVDLARAGYADFAARMRVEVPWEDAPPRMKLAWQAVIRHLVNCDNFNADEDLSSHELRWKDWTEQKLQTG